MTRAEAEAVIAELLPGCRVRVVWCADVDVVGDVLVDGASALPETMRRIEALGVQVAAYDPDPGRAYARRSRRPLQVAPASGPRFRYSLSVVDGHAAWVAIPEAS